MRKMSEQFSHDAFAGESMAHMKYLAFSEVAEKEGFKNVARLYKAVAYAEQVHATAHARNLGLIKKTAENLQTGVNGENYEVDEMYPVFMKAAEIQGEKAVEKACHFAIEAEKIHAVLYADAKKSVEAGKDYEIGTVYICPVCGFTHIGNPPEKCPVCGIPSQKFVAF